LSSTTRRGDRTEGGVASVMATYHCHDRRKGSPDRAIRIRLLARACRANGTNLYRRAPQGLSLQEAARYIHHAAPSPFGGVR